MLIRGAEVWGTGLADLRLSGGRIAAIGAITPEPWEPVIEARGRALLPGLHDHHLHLPALAAARASVACGPPQVSSRSDLAAALAGAGGTGWIRGTGYHESVMGLPSARELDALEGTRPLRIQHRSGRMWLLNTPALDALLALSPPPSGLEAEHGCFTGRLFDEDRWLRDALRASPPDLLSVGRDLAAWGVTGVTDMGPANAPAFAAWLAGSGLPQRLVIAGRTDLADGPADGWRLGPVKLHLHENAMPGWDESLALLACARAQGRGLAVHCTTEVELVWTLALLEVAGSAPGDRIEHASLADTEQVARIAALGLPVVAQPHFIRERGDQYRADIPEDRHGDLYRLQSLRRAGIVLAGGSDAPFGSADPWAAMQAATDRRTLSGTVIGADEALEPEAALALFLADPLCLGRQRVLAPGVPADLVLLDRPWAEARADLSAVRPLATWIGGRIVHDGIDQPDGERLAR